MDKKILYLDMDGVLVDFVSGIRKYDPEALLPYKDHPDEAPGIFSLMDPIPGAKEAVERLSEDFDIYILSTAPWMNPSAWTDKVVWVKEHYGDILKKRIIISHRKDLLRGDFLVDDRPKHGASEFQGEWIQFGSEKFPTWDTVEKYLATKKGNVDKSGW